MEVTKPKERIVDERPNFTKIISYIETDKIRIQIPKKFRI